MKQDDAIENKKKCKREEKKEARRKIKIFILNPNLAKMKEVKTTKKRKWFEGCTIKQKGMESTRRPYWWRG